MPNSGRQLSRRGVYQVKAFEEGGHARCMRGFADVGVSPFCRVPKKGSYIKRGAISRPYNKI